MKSIAKFCGHLILSNQVMYTLHIIFCLFVISLIYIYLWLLVNNSINSKKSSNLVEYLTRLKKMYVIQENKKNDLNILNQYLKNWNETNIDMIDDLAERYHNLHEYQPALELHLISLKLKKNKNEILKTLNKIMLLHSEIGDQEAARKVFLKIQDAKNTEHIYIT